MPAIQCPVSRISNFIKLRFPAGHHGFCSTPPGHILHLVTEGHYRLSINQHEFEAEAGQYIIYHDIEQVEWIHNPVDVEFYSIVFNAEHLSPRPFSKRVVQAQPRFHALLTQQFHAYHQAVSQPFPLFSLLLDMLDDLYQHDPLAADNPHDTAWTQLEHKLRSQGLFRPTLNQCCDLIGMSPASLNRCCQSLHQQSPMQRLRFVRIEHAKSLLQLSPMTISQIAYFLDYPRVHEFSREFKFHSGNSPKAFRKEHAHRIAP